MDKNSKSSSKAKNPQDKVEFAEEMSMDMSSSKSSKSSKSKK